MNSPLEPVVVMGTPAPRLLEGPLRSRMVTGPEPVAVQVILTLSPALTAVGVEVKETAAMAALMRAAPERTTWKKRMLIDVVVVVVVVEIRTSIKGNTRCICMERTGGAESTSDGCTK